LTLTLSIGANGIFSVMEAVLLRPHPYPDADRLVLLSESSEQIPDMGISMANFNDWRSENKVFENMLAYQNDDTVWSGKIEPDRPRMFHSAAGFTATLRIQPILGRTLSPEDDKVGAVQIELLGRRFWESRFGGDRNVIGQMNLDSEPYTIIGVFPDRMHAALRQVDVFTPLWRLEDQLGGEKRRDSHPGIYAYARVHPGVSLQQAQSEMIAIRLDQLHPDTNGKNSISVQPLLGAIVEDVRPSILLRVASVSFVLLIGCANIANLLLARAQERYRELAVRAEDNTSARCFSVLLISIFAILALSLATVGIYGVISYSVSQRNREIGIRMALGAAPREVRGMVLRQGMRLAALGILLGIAGSLLLTRLIASLSFRVSAFDSTTFVAGKFVLAIILLFSTWLPARRASRVDPIALLRYECDRGVATL
jgi:putative ABC transport system permease protein